jgi:pimeloyl-ACP methyl ester carboxylesterase
MSYVLVHGAGMGASCWDKLVPLLDAPVVAVDLPGRGSRSDHDIRTVTLDDCAAAIVEDVLVADVRDIVMVAHSFAGVSVPRVLGQLADRLKHVVFLSAVLPPNGTRVIDQIDPGVRGAVEQAIAGGVYSQDRDSAAAMLCNDMDAVETAWTCDRVVDDSAALLTETVDLSGLAVDVPRTYVRLRQDVCYTPELQESSAALVGGSVEYLDTGHMAMVSDPDGLASLLREIASAAQ